jgi:hypothetical protein
MRDDLKFPTGVGKFLIDNGLAISQDDGLFEDTLPGFDRFLNSSTTTKCMDRTVT